jgi:hypothetical protein
MVTPLVKPTGQFHFLPDVLRPQFSAVVSLEHGSTPRGGI